MEIQESWAGRGHGISVPLLHILPWVSLSSDCSWVISFHNNWQSGEQMGSLSSVSHSRKLIEPKDEGGRLNSQLVRRASDNLACNWPLKERALLQFWALSLQNLMLSLSKWCQNWVELWDTQFIGCQTQTCLLNSRENFPSPCHTHIGPGCSLLAYQRRRIVFRKVTYFAKISFALDKQRIFTPSKAISSSSQEPFYTE